MAGIYIHIPFCRQACTYCNFHFSTLLKNKKEVMDAMLKEIALQQHYFPEKTVIDTIYFGGGTPSLLTTEEINSIIKEIEKHHAVSENAEITLEANPDDLSDAFLSALRKETTINRLSIGVQSFFDEDLQYMNRAHNASDARSCIQLAKDAGFHNLSIDLIYGTPTMSNERWKENLDILFAMHVPHISCYAMTVEEKTPLADFIKKKKALPPGDEQTAQQFSVLLEEMKTHGYTQYEISNFCKEPHFVMHNTNYWKGIPYLGIGPSAHSYNGTQRSWNVSNNALYAKKIMKDEPANEYEVLSITEKYNEYVMTSLRTMWGVDVNYILQHFGEDFQKHFLLEVSPFISNKWVNESGTIYTLTDSGKLFCDYITEHLFVE
jgi:oxygen-independent coproporphyrinogen-3 oxidase